GAAQSIFNIALTSTQAPSTQVSYSASTGSSSWLAATPQSAATPQNLQVFVAPSSLSASSTPYQGTITISSTSWPSGSIAIPYSLTVTPNITVALSPLGTIAFMQPQGGPSPQSQNLTLTSTGGNAQYTAQVNPITGGSWLQVNGGPSASGAVNPTASLALS